MFTQNKGGFTGFGNLGSTGTAPSTGFTLGSTTSTSGNAGAAGSLFGTAPSASTATGSLGQSTTGFTFDGKTAFGTQPATSAPVASTGYSFGQTAQPAGQASATTALGSVGQLSFAPKTSQTTTSSLPSLGTSGFTFNTQLTGTSQPATTAPTFGLGLVKPLGACIAPTSSVEQKGLSLAGPTFGQASVASVKPTQPVSLLGSVPQAAATSSSIGFGLSTKTTVATAAATTTTSSNTANAQTIATAATGSDKPFTYQHLEDVINKWVQELEEQETIFLKQAKQVNAWDKILIDNGEKITLINDEIQRLKTDQSRLDRELDFILSQQQELEEILSPLVDEIKAQQSVPFMQHANLEREKTYKMAENIDTQLKRMMQDIKDIINHINTSNANTSETEDPMTQIAKILNSHMDALQWVYQNADLLQRKVEEVNKQVEGRRREQERSLRLTYAD